MDHPMLKQLPSTFAVAAGLIVAEPLAAHDSAAATYRSGQAEFGPATADTWITLDDHGRPVEIGVGISEAGFAAFAEHPYTELSLPLLASKQTIEAEVK